MAEQDVFSKYGGTALADSSEQTPVGGTAQVKSESADPFSKYGGRSFSTESVAGPEPTQPVAPKAGQDSIFSKYGGSSLNPDDISSPNRPTPISTSIETADANAPWYKKAWDWANSPIIDEQHIENWLGRQSASGFEKGVYDLIAGFTSPLQVALTIGTFGSGALFESGGMAALKAAGMGLEEAAEVAKGSDLITKAIKAGKTAQDAYLTMPSLGIDAQRVAEGLETITKAGLTPESLINTGIVRNTGGAMLRSAGVGVADADKIANWGQFALDAGFTVQNAYGAVIASPRVLDAIKEGDYDTAARLAVNALGSGAFAALGARQTAHHAGELMEDAAVKAGLKVKPSEETVKMVRVLEAQERRRVVTMEAEKSWEEDMRKRYKDLSSEDMQLARMKYESGSDEDMASWHNMIADAAGRPDDKIKVPRDIELRPTKNESMFAPTAMVHDIYRGDEKIGEAHVLKKGGEASVEWIGQPQDAKAATIFEGAPSRQKDLINTLGVKGVRSLKEQYLEQNPDTERFTGNRVTGASAASGVDSRFIDIPAARKKGYARLQELVKEQNLKDKPKDYVDDLLAATDYRSLNERHAEFGKEVSDHFSKTLEGAQIRDEDGNLSSLGALGEGLENYITRIWKDPNNDTVKKFSTLSKSNGFSVNTSMARKRVFESTLEGILKGYELADHDPIALAAHNGNEFGRVTANRSTIGELRDRGVRASDGRPMVAVSGTGHMVEGEEGENPSTVINPRGMQAIRISKKVLKGLEDNGELDRLVEQGKIVQYGADKSSSEPMYAWTTHDYKTVDNPAFRAWKVPTTDTEGRPIMVEGEIRAHPDAHEYLQRRFGTEESVVKKIPGMKTVLAAGREAKGILLFGSPFHAIQEGLRAIMTGISPFGIEKFNPENPIHLQAAEKGVWEAKDYRGVRAFEDGMMGHSRIISKIPGLREIQSSMQSFLFDRYIPGLKLRSFGRLLDRYKEAYPEWSPNKVAEVAAADTNERFGGIAYRRMGRSVGAMDATRLLTLAPDWLESEVRVMARMFGEEGKLARRDMAKMALYMWGAARVLNYLSSGQPHNEAPFGVSIKDSDGRQKIYSLRTLPTDMLHAVSDPGGFLQGRVAPLVRVAAQTYTGRDEFGRKLPSHGVFVNMLRNVAPIPLQSIGKKLSGESDASFSDAAVKAAGATVFPYRTEAQKEAAKLASDHSESGPVDQDKLRRHQAIIEIENNVRRGETRLQDVYKMVESGQLHVDEAKAILKNATDTKEMDPEMARLYSHATRLPLSEMIGVWNKATNEEKAALSQLLLKKKQAYLKKVNKNMAVSERVLDPTYQWIRKNFPSDPPF